MVVRAWMYAGVACLLNTSISSAQDINATAQDRLREDDLIRMRTCLRATRSARELIRSGDLSVRFAFREGDLSKEMIVNVMSIWNEEKRLVRFDYDRPHDKRRGRFIRGMDASWFETADGSVNKFSVDWSPDEFLFRPFDVRTFGLASPIQFQKRRLFNDLFLDWDDESLWHKVTVEGPLVRMVLRKAIKNAISEDEMVVDTAAGFTPVERIWRGLDLTQEAATISSNKVLVRWKETSGVWVPESAIFETNAGNYHAVSDVTFEWRCVNCDPDSKYFDPDSFALPPETYVVDYSLDNSTPIVVGRLKEPEAVLLTPATSNRWLLFVNVVALVVIGCAMVCRRYFIRKRFPPA